MRGKAAATFDKMAWQRQYRARFRDEHGYSDRSHYATGALRAQVLERDGHRCVRCGMTDAEHKELWGRPITIDHKDKNRQHNTMDNLQTLCLSCHGRKDLVPRLRQQQVPVYKDEILAARSKGEPYQSIADRLGFSVAAIWKWTQRWNAGLEAVSA